MDRVVASLPYSVMSKPMGHEPGMPEDVTKLLSHQLGELHGKFASFEAWLLERLALAETDADTADVWLEQVQAQTRLAKSGTVADKNAKAATSPLVMKAKQDLLFLQARAKLLKARVRGFEKLTAALSREMTRREKLADER